MTTQLPKRLIKIHNGQQFFMHH